MVHTFSYAHKGRNYHFLWDAESGSLHNIDRPAYLVAKERYSELDDAQRIEYKGLDNALIDEINAEFSALEETNQLNTPAPEGHVRKKIGEIKALCLHICHDCNLRCQYCFAGEGTYHTARYYMSFEVGKAAIDFLIEHSGKRHNLEVDFFGGEPLMNLDVVKRIVEYARSVEKANNKRFSFTMTTNCVLLDDATIEWLNEEMSNVVLSIDGRPNIHNAVRRTVNGKDAYNIILANAKKFASVRGDKSYYVRGTFTSNNLDFADDIIYLRDQGFQQISVEPVVLPLDDSLAITQQHLPAILKEYERLAELYLESRANGKWFNFFHFMLDLEGGPCVVKRLTGCGSGCEYLSVTPIGDIYPCHQFAEEEGYKMGNVLNGDFSTKVSEVFSENAVTNKPACKDCPAKYYCSGGCAANNAHFAGGIDNPYPISCEMMKKRFELSLAIAAIERSAT